MKFHDYLVGERRGRSVGRTDGREDRFDLGAECSDAIARLRCTPSSAIGSCRYKLGNDLVADREKYERVLAILSAHDIRYFFFMGDNDSIDSADKVRQFAHSHGYDLRVIAIARTFDNNVIGADHCPGYGSVANFLTTCVMEAGRDTESMYTFDPVTICETKGRDTSWIAATPGTARRRPDEAPHLIYAPEISSSIERPSGHQQHGVAHDLCPGATAELGPKARYNKLDTCPRNAMHFASRTDSDEAYLCGQAAVRQAIAGAKGMVVTSQQPYQGVPARTPFAEVPNGVRALPRECRDDAGTISGGMQEYAGPLIRGEAGMRIGPDGLSMFVRFQHKAVPRGRRPFIGKT